MRAVVWGLVLVLGGCRSKVSTAADACLRAEVEYFSDDSPTTRRLAPLACSDLYRHTACGEAWRKELSLADTFSDYRHSIPAHTPDAGRIIQECSKLYCTELGADSFGCSEPLPADGDVLARQLRQLDTAILTYELGDAKLAAGLARRSVVFRPTVVSVPAGAVTLDLPPGDVQQRVTVELLVDHTVRLNDKPVTTEQLGAELAKLGAGGNVRATIRADARVTHGEVIAMLDTLKQAHITKIAFAVMPKEAGEASP